MNDIRLAQLSMYISKAKELGNPNYPPMVELFDEVMEQRKKVKELQKVMQDIHGKLNNGSSHEFEETIQYCITKAFYALKGVETI